MDERLRAWPSPSRLEFLVHGGALASASSISWLTFVRWFLHRGGDEKCAACERLAPNIITTRKKFCGGVEVDHTGPRHDVIRDRSARVLWPQRDLLAARAGCCRSRCSRRQSRNQFVRLREQRITIPFDITVANFEEKGALRRFEQSCGRWSNPEGRAGDLATALHSCRSPSSVSPQPIGKSCLRSAAYVREYPFRVGDRELATSALT